IGGYGYYAGHGSGATSWGPIMGDGIVKNLSQWSKGEYLNADNGEDDLAVIANNNNQVGFRADDTGDTLATAKYLEIFSDNTVSSEGFIGTTGEVDAFRFVSSGGQTTLNLNTTVHPNLDILAEIVNAATNTVITSDNPDASLNATVTANLPAGEYLLRVRGTGRGNPLGDGYTNYDCLGAYTISGSVSGGVLTDRFALAENPANGAVIGTVAARVDHGANPVTWAIASGNGSGGFSIDPSTGILSVSNPAVFDYELQSPHWDDPATFELFVTSVDAVNPSLNESIRVVVTLTNVNETPVIQNGSYTILERRQVPTVVGTVTASDPDEFDFPIFTITAGNTENIFTIDGTGKVTFAANVEVPATTTYNLTIRATDHGTPALWVEGQFSVTVVNIAAGYQPGNIVRTYFEGLPWAAVYDLTSSPKFPNMPDSQEVLSAFDGGAHGDEYGSQIRGYVIPPVSGTYQFWIASDDSSELRINSTGTDPAGASVIASVNGATARYAWTVAPSQQSVTFNLTEGQPYYIEARHKEGGGDDHVEVAWSGPGI
ncbi:MAG TPA: cadherin domain-containing protein, partial [Luteolibacter sp.]